MGYLPKATKFLSFQSLTSQHTTDKMYGSKQLENWHTSISFYRKH